MCDQQGEQGIQGPPGPFEYVDPPEDLYIKGEQVGPDHIYWPLLYPKPPLFRL